MESPVSGEPLSKARSVQATVGSALPGPPVTSYSPLAPSISPNRNGEREGDDGEKRVEKRERER